MKKFFVILLVLCLCVAALTACSMTTEDIANQDQLSAEKAGLTLHKIGVPTYQITNPQVMGFKSYLDTYIKSVYPDVTFIYSDSLSNTDDMMVFLQNCAEQGVEGILGLTSYDMKKEIAFCADHGMYYVRASGTTADADFEAMSAEKYYVGEIGPGKEIEISSGVNMTRALAAKGDGKNFMVLSGGAPMGNEMHRLRTVAILDTLQEIYGLSYPMDVEKLAVVSENTELDLGVLKLVMVPGYTTMPNVLTSAEKYAQSGAYQVGLSVGPVDDLVMNGTTGSVRFGVIDFFSEVNSVGFRNGSIAYVAGKYNCEIGPAFVAIYNAVTGHGDAFRENGKAFRMTQGFWEAADKETYDTMYSLANGATVTAYNYEDLYAVTAESNPAADFAALEALTEAYSYEDCLARRNG